MLCVINQKTDYKEMIKIIIGFLLIIIGINSYSQELDFSNEIVDSILIDFKDKWEIPGISVAIAKDGRLIYAKGFGYADTLKEEPVTTNSLFRIASCSKTITALGIMKLEEDKIIGFDDMVFGENGILNESVSASLQMNSFNYSPSVFRMLWLMNRSIKKNRRSSALDIP